MERCGQPCGPGCSDGPSAMTWYRGWLRRWTDYPAWGPASPAPGAGVSVGCCGGQGWEESCGPQAEAGVWGFLAHPQAGLAHFQRVGLLQRSEGEQGAGGMWKLNPALFLAWKKTYSPSLLLLREEQARGGAALRAVGSCLPRGAGLWWGRLCSGASAPDA